MRVPLRWLHDYVEPPTDDPEELASVFESLGHEVEGIDHLPLDFSGVVTGRVEGITLHPEASKVRLCSVTTGRGTTEVWCGAWNFEEGAVVAYGPPGAALAGGFQLGVRRMFGVDSNGMICSERELGLGDDHTGILVLDPSTEIGVDFASLVERPDWVLDVSITPNRPDVMSLVGVARELAAYYEIPYRLPDHTVAEATVTSQARVRIDDPSGCYRFNGREVSDVTVRPSPLRLRQRLRAAGVRPISNVVDVTNYVMLELGQPLHAFDLDRVAGEQLVVRWAAAGERLTTLDGVERTLTPDDLVVADAERASALAGTMGGEDSEVSDATTRVYIEGAAWDPPTVMYMSRRHNLRSEASARFERGVDPGLGPMAVSRAARLMAELTGGSPLAGAQDVVAVEIPPHRIVLTTHDVTRVLGPGFDPPAIAGLLGRLGLTTEGDDPMSVTVPTYRRDLTRPIDLVEEIARLHGYDRFGESIPFGRGGGWTVEQIQAGRLRAALTGLGLSQSIPLSFMRLDDLDALGIPDGDPRRLTVRVRNPLREEESALRTTLLPGLLRAARHNLAQGTADVALFETGKVFFDETSEEHPRLPDQPDHLGFVMIGRFGDDSLGTPARPVDVYTATAVWRVIADRLDVENWDLEAAGFPGLHPGRTARIVVAGQPVGHLGELHPATARAFELPVRVAVGELALAPLTRERPHWQFREPSAFPPTTFDLAFQLPLDVPARSLLEATGSAAGDLLERVEVFDEYTGTGLPPATKSLALSFVLRAPDRTLTGEEAAAIRRSMVEAAGGLGGLLRGKL
ncbi:MAG: phenylalanine--tRNA ligase subunit beta [Acidimicrobiia bacterium]|jgi:phenylalanyl-tRNA synthetase beta chain